MLVNSWVKWSLAAVLALGTIPAAAMARPVKRVIHHVARKTTTAHKITAHAPLRTTTPMKLAAVSRAPISHTPARRLPAKPVHHTPVKKMSKKVITHKTSHKKAPAKIVHKTSAH